MTEIWAEDLGDRAFRDAYGLRYACYAGAMAGGISSVELVAAMGEAGFMGSFGAGGLSARQVEEAADALRARLGGRPFLVNLLAQADAPRREMQIVEALLFKNVQAVEASAYIRPSEALVRFRATGAHEAGGRAVAAHRVIAKLSREEVAEQFMLPPDRAVLDSLVSKGMLTPAEAGCAARLPLADDITVEANSGGHTDGKDLVSLFPAIRALRDRVRARTGLNTRLGAAGGIATPGSALAAFAMDAAYVVTGSVNQSCTEAGTSDYVKGLLAQAKMSDTMTCPSADMFELGSRVQVLKLRTMYPLNAQKLYNYYCSYPSYEEIPAEERNRIENRIFRESYGRVLEESLDFLRSSDPIAADKAAGSPKAGMALAFRWYLGKAMAWAIQDEVNRRPDMKIYCGQSMGAFNLWVKGTELEDPKNRHAADIARRILEGAAALYNENLKAMRGGRE